MRLHPEIEPIGRGDHSGQKFVIYRAPATSAHAAHPFYFSLGPPLGPQDDPPYCTHPTIASAFHAEGWSKRTPWQPLERCDPCRQVFALHCSDPVSCGGMKPVCDNHGYPLSKGRSAQFGGT